MEESSKRDLLFIFCHCNSEFLDHVGKCKSNYEFHTTHLRQRHTWKRASVHTSTISFPPRTTLLCHGVPTLLLGILQPRNCLAKDFMISQGCNIIQLTVFLFKTTPQPLLSFTFQNSFLIGSLYTICS